MIGRTVLASAVLVGSLVLVGQRQHEPWQPTAVCVQSTDSSQILATWSTDDIDSLIAACDARKRPAVYCPEDAWCAVAQVNATGTFHQTGR